MAADGNHPTRFDVIVNHKPFPNNDPILKGRDILELAGLRPAAEHMLLERDDAGLLIEIDLNEDVNLRKPPAETFYAFRSDRLFYLLVDDRRFPWGAAAISEADLREIAHVPADRQLFQERRDEADLLLTPGAVVRLDGPGVERFYTAEAPECGEVELDGEMVPLKGGTYTTESLKAALGVDPRWDLDIIENGVLRQLQPGETIVVVCGVKLVSHVRQGGSS